MFFYLVKKKKKKKQAVDSRNKLFLIIGDRQDLIIYLVFSLLVTVLVEPVGAFLAL